MAISLRLPAPPSDEELVELSERNPGFGFERTAEGELIVTPTGGEAGRSEAELVGQLHTWAVLDRALGGPDHNTARRLCASLSRCGV